MQMLWYRFSYPLAVLDIELIGGAMPYSYRTPSIELYTSIDMSSA